MVHGLETLKRLNDQASASSDLSACLGADAQLADAVPPRLGDGLLPCPFCGQEQEDIWGVELRDDDGSYQWVACRKCDATGPMVQSETLAIELWNKRAGGSQAKSTQPESHDG
jgi:Lar family restriction alleviation protein